MTGESPALSLGNVSKTFPGQRALEGVGLELARGEVRALLGENGSGKSTLIKCLAGYHEPDAGWKASAGGEPLHLGSAAAARVAGIRFIHQDLGLVRELDIVDNLALGDRYAGRFWIGRRREAKEARRLLEMFGIDLDVNSRLRSLSPAEQTIVAIVRALRDGLEGRVLVLDEPTASLPATEVARLFEVVKAVRDSGGSVIYVTHRLQEVFEIADTVTVLRDGREVASRPVKGLDEEQLVELLVGRAVGSMAPDVPPVREDLAFVAEDIAGERLDGVTIKVHQGEIVGVAGIVGSGREELPYLLFGARPWERGTVQVGDETFHEMSISRSIEAGIVFAPADRQRDSALQNLTARENVTLPDLPMRRGWLGKRAEAREARDWLERLDIRPPDPERPMRMFSGGNQQRIVLARWLRCAPRVLLLEEPTRGVDIAAKVEIYRVIASAARDGAAAIICSSDAEEMATVCDRVLVLRDGRVVVELSGRALTEEAIVEESVYERVGSLA